MKDIVVTHKRLKKERYIFLTCFSIAFMINMYSIIKFKTSMYELFTQIGYVLVIAIAIYIIVLIVRAILILIKNLIRHISNY